MASSTIKRTALYLALLSVLAGCSKKSEMPASQVSADKATASAPAAPPVERAAQADAGIMAKPSAVAQARESSDAADSVSGSVTAASPVQQMGSSAATITNDGAHKFIRTANARFAVKDVYVAALGIEDAVASHGGFVVSNGITTETMNTSSHPIGDGKLLELKQYVVQGALVVRVPSAKTQEFLRAIVGHITFLDARHFAARDAQFDLLRQQLEALRNQETQGELGTALNGGGKLEQRTNAIQARDDSKAARDEAILARKAFEDQVAFSTIELTLHQPSRVLKTERIDVQAVMRQHQIGFFRRLGEAGKSGWEGMQDVMIGLVSIWPLTLAVMGIGAMVWRTRRRRTKSIVPEA